ncbi:MAG: DUF3823 domain-containing protein [Chitinophagaceae bacterium]
MKNIVYFLMTLLVLSSCKVDNFIEPDLTVSGRIIDAKTSALVESGGSNGGTIVKFYQNTSTQALLFKTMPDGTFTNSRVFASNYKYVAEGPFQIMTDTPSVAVKANTQIDIKVTPNVRLTTSMVSKSGTEAVIKVTYEKVSVSQTMTKLGLVWSNVIEPNIFTFTGGNIITNDVQSMNLTSGNREFIIKGLKAGTKYFVRATSATNAPGNYYNYSTQIEVQN